jgi:hypothetical protein
MLQFILLIAPIDRGYYFGFCYCKNKKKTTLVNNLFACLAEVLFKLMCNGTVLNINEEIKFRLLITKAHLQHCCSGLSTIAKKCLLYQCLGSLITNLVAVVAALFFLLARFCIFIKV